MIEEQQEKPEQPLTNTQGPGEILKQARKKLGLSAADIAAKLHLKLINIEAIEADNYDPKISPTFTKGYLKLYAKQVQVDEKLILEAFAQQHLDEKEPQKLQSFSKRVAKQNNDARLMLLTYLIIAALLAMVVVWWFQQDSSESAIANISESVAAAQIEAISDEQQQQPAPNLAPTADDLIVSAQLDEDGPSDLSNNQNDAQNNTLQQVEDDIQPQLSVPDGPIVQPEMQTIELIFEFADDCWMNLTDSTGEAIAYGVKKSGRVMTVSGVAPFEVTLGAPDVVKISYDGVMVDMSRFPAGKSAKFSLPFSQ